MCQPRRLGKPVHRAHLCRIAGHGQISPSAKAPAMQLALLHGRHHIGAVRAPGYPDMRASPVQTLRGPAECGGPPKGHTAIMRDGQPLAFRIEGEAGHGAWMVGRSSAHGAGRVEQPDLSPIATALAFAGRDTASTSNWRPGALSNSKVDPSGVVRTILPSSPPETKPCPSMSTARHKAAPSWTCTARPCHRER